MTRVIKESADKRIEEQEESLVWTYAAVWMD